MISNKVLAIGVAVIMMSLALGAQINTQQPLKPLDDSATPPVNPEGQDAQPTSPDGLGAISLPSGFEAVLLADGLDRGDGLKGITSALFRAGNGPFGHDLYVAYSPDDSIYKVDKDGAGATHFADVGDFPVGVEFGAYDGFKGYLYVGLALEQDWAVVRVDSEGTVTPFSNVTRTSGLAFSPPGSGYGKYLYAATYWSEGRIFRIDKDGVAEEFKDSIPGQSRYLEFSHGGPWGHYLFVSEITSGKIYKVYPDASNETFAETNATWGVEGFDFSPGGVWGHYMFVGVAFGADAGKIFRIDPDGNVELWASGFEGVADIHFEPGGKGGFTMYIVTNGSGEVYAISKA